MIGIIGKKLGMTQIFNEQGQQIPCTVVEAPPNPVLMVTDPATTGMAQIQLGYGAQRLARPNAKGERTPRGRRARRPEVGHAAKAGLAAPPRVLRTVRLDDAPGVPRGTSRGAPPEAPEAPAYKVGDRVDIGVFAVGDTVKVTGTTKGRGFQGVVKRHSFAGGPNTHGNTKHRRPGSIGPGTDPSRVIKGKRMPGHYGDERHTQTHLRVERVDLERHLLYIRGAVAGPKNGIVLVRKQG
jgi:large subunit ribosomal protein L3